MITIIADRHGYDSPPPAALVAQGTADYVAVRRRIRIALDHDEPLIVYTADPVVLGWLVDLQRYPEARIAWRVVDPGQKFSDLFGVAPADPFTPARISALHLHTMPKPPAGVFVDPLTWILGHRLDPIWQYDEPPPEHLTLLAEWIIARASPLDPDLVVLAQAQLERWAIHQAHYRAIHATSAADDSTNLLVRWALRGYAADWRNTQPWVGMPTLESEPSSSALLIALHSQYEAIHNYWGRQITGAVIDSHFVEAALAQMVGLSEAELHALKTMIDRQPAVLDKQLLHSIEARFSRLPGAQTTLRSLAEQVAPAQPLLPDLTWPAEHWLRWATQQYLPYFAWVVRSGHGRAHQQTCALAYSDWLYGQYQVWLDDDQSPLLLRQYQEMSTLVADDNQTVVIWLIVDGMAWWQGDIMREACERHGLHVQAQRPGVAILPSITSVSKRALVTGQPIVDVPQTTISEAARIKLERSAIPAWVGYRFSDALGVLQQTDQKRVFVVLFNMIDALSHETTTFTDNAGIRGYLEDLATKLSAAQQICMAQGRKLHVLIGSDHGSTLLPEDASSISLPNSVREIDDAWEVEFSGQTTPRPGTRAAATDLEHIPGFDTQLWYALDRHRFQLDQHYLVPRGYGYIKRRPSGWTHGGLTPEETIVPMLHLAGERPHILPLEAVFQGSLRVGQAGSIILMMRNLNAFPVQDVAVTVSGAAHEVYLDHMGALDQQELELHFATVMAQGTDLSITYEVRYNAFGSPHRHTRQARVALRRLQTEDTSFDDLFN